MSRLLKTVILAGGLGTRLAEETTKRPKPMVEIGGTPILVHIMSIYAAHGFNEFIVAAGYLGHVIKDYFNNFHLNNSDFTISLKDGERTIEKPVGVDWKVSLIDTGAHTMTGGRILRLRDRLKEGTFMVTYGDGVADIDIGALVDFHRSHGKLATVSAVRPPARFGALVLDDTRVERFAEKHQSFESWINGGFFVFEPGVLDYIAGDSVPLEREPLTRLAADGELMAYQHPDFWQCMDTIRDRNYLEELWSSGDAPWRTG